MNAPFNIPSQERFRQLALATVLIFTGIYPVQKVPAGLGLPAHGIVEQLVELIT